jgi:putative ABC transport system permease protein
LFQNYFKIAWRNLVKNRASSIINIGGLSIGMAVAMLIGLWIYDELSFNQIHKSHDRIAQVMWHSNSNGETMTYSYNPGTMGEELRRSYGSFFTFVATSTYTSPNVLSYGDKKISMTGNYMEQDAPALLSMDLLAGNMAGLKDPHSIMISESSAKAFFGKSDPVGKMMALNSSLNVRVTGVYKDFPLNSDFRQVFFIVPWQLLILQAPRIMSDPSAWDFNDFQVFVQLAPRADLQQVSDKIKDIRRIKMSKESVHSLNPVVFLQPMNKWHLYSEFKNGVNVGGRIQYVWMFGITGVFVLLLACINFMTLSTARSEKRAKEVGIRKTIGSLRAQLVGQFFSEAFLVSVLAFIFSMLLVWLSLPFFNILADKKMSILWGDPLFWLLSLGCCIVVGLFSGLYPALYLSSFRPIRVLKGSFRTSHLAVFSRRALVVLQFIVSVVLMICTLVVYRQIKFGKDRFLGYDSDRLITLRMTPDIQKHFEVIKNELKQSQTVESMAGSVNSTIDFYVDVIDISWKGKDPNSITDFAFNNVTENYGKTIGWQIKDGRDFSLAYASDSSAFILNESAVKIMGFRHPIGEKIERQGKTFTVIGVIKDIIFESPYKQVMPSIFYMIPHIGYATVSIKIKPGIEMNKALAQIEGIFRKFNPSFPFDYKFVDEEYAKKFSDEQRIGRLAGFFTVLAIFISCLGLFGLTTFIAERRTKEIVIRKILGAGIWSLWSLLSKEFMILVFISLAIAVPLGFYLMHHWLQNYSYRVEISAWIFVAAGSGALLITLLTVSYQALVAAFSNPVRVLRSE